MATPVQEHVLAGIAGKRAAVIGMGVTNTPLVRFLVRAGVRVTACDRKPEAELSAEIAALSGLGVEFALGTSYLDDLDGFDILYLSPGVNPNQPEIEAAHAQGAAFGSEIDLVLRLSSAPVIGITGSSGKTTTTTLTGLILREDARRFHPERTVHVGGNIGTPLIDRVMSVGRDDLIVLELSSFQLRPLRISPHIGAVLNITPNHLDIHPDMEDYISSKENIVKCQTEDDWGVFGADNAPSLSMSERAPGQVMLFSAEHPVPRGAFLRGDSLILRGPEGDESEAAVVHRNEILLPGLHNVQNILAAMTVCAGAGADRRSMAEVIRTFKGVEHRLEKAGMSGGVEYINDSIATTPARTMAALRAVETPIVLIAGGYDKRLPFDEMADLAIGHVHTLVLVGVTADKIEQAFASSAARRGVAPPAVIRSNTFRDAVHAAREAASPGDTVLLSPACASYGMFRNFEERGRMFKEIVRQFPG
ncbi:MAG: UDP-N-acetylmuramoyl-L-alanine--D-glutamate ligase [Clostridia bacterium]|nr:UDP-N-acetylmuramoyl-L-alanine--D-glutamate ligase [Clostridia bacterium]